jgi:two-component system sensor histidine kinase KdpD
MNSDPSRRDPDQLLSQSQSEERQNQRGRLKIFLGYVAGVGKTYAMLEAAHQRKDEGIDVVVGYVETHHRKEIEELLKGLEVLPCQSIGNQGITLTEMHLDVVLERQAQLVVVDELAHTNVSGSRHPKRYQDVEEILAAGIDVYTTVNIQHLASLNDVIQQITGVQVRETVPDKVFDAAHEIELIDLPTDELLQRLNDGKVYVPDQSARAVEKFFRKGNLTALREMALRRAAERVDSQMRSYMQAKAIPGPWPAKERILVSLSSHPLGERLVRAGKRLADDLNAEWFVLFVDTPGHFRMPQDNKDRMQRNLILAEELGGKIFRVRGQSVVDEIIHICRQQNITKIVAGKPIRPRWQEIIKQSVTDEILRNSGNVDVYVVSEQDESLVKFPGKSWTMHRPYNRYFSSIALVIVATLFGLLIRPYIDPTNLVMIYLAAVVVAAVFLGRGPSMLASMLSVLLFDFFMVKPHFSLAVDDTQYLITFAGLLVVGLIISNSASLLRDQVSALRIQENQTQALNRFSQELTGAVHLEEVLDIVIKNIASTFSRDIVVFLPEHGKLVQKAATQDSYIIDVDETLVAEWAYKNGVPAGHGTETLAEVIVRFSPLITARGVVGVLGIKPGKSNDELTPEQKLLFGGFNNLSALAIERAKFAEDSLEAETLRTAEKLQTALLNSISHQLRTPLATISGVLTSVGESERNLNSENKLDSQTKIDLIDTATDQANQLNRLVENLLDMTRLEAGAIHVHHQLGDLQDLIGAVATQMAGVLGNRPLSIHIPEDIPNVTMDAVLTGQVLINLLDNACKYSPPNSPISITARQAGDLVEVMVKDAGPGIPQKEHVRVFEKFYRLEQSRHVTGSGLGLSICKGIVEAQGGTIRVQNNPDQGVCFIFTLPMGNK